MALIMKIKFTHVIKRSQGMDA